ncbi:hypothetical protein Tsubulata_048441, partial [Turnera subulata]
TINQSFVKQSQPLTLSSSTQNSMKSKNPFVTSGEIKAGGGSDRIYHATILESPSSHHTRLPDRHNNLHYGCGCGSRSVQKITFELIMKQLMSFDPGEWTESLRKEYVLSPCPSSPPHTAELSRWCSGEATTETPTVVVCSSGALSLQHHSTTPICDSGDD